MSAPAPTPSPTPVPTASGFNAKGILMNILWVCLSVLAVAFTLFMVVSMSGCQRTGGNSFMPSSAWGAPSAQEEVSRAAHDLVMPSNFADVSKITPAKVDEVHAVIPSKWPTEAQQRFKEGFNPVFVRVKGKAKPEFYGEPNTPWNPDPNMPPALRDKLKAAWK